MTIVAAFPYGKKDRSALHLAAHMARSMGEQVRIVSIVPVPGKTMIPTGSDLQFAVWARERGQNAVAEARQSAAEICPDVETEAVFVEARSRASGLVAEATRTNASVLVVGSGTEGARGKVRVSATSDRLLHSSPVPVGLAPRGYRSTPDVRVPRVTCSFRGDEGAEGLVARASQVARRADARLRLATFAVTGRATDHPSLLSEDSRRAEFVSRVTSAQAAALEGVTDDEPVEDAVAIGRNWKAALDALEWSPGEVLVVGSSPDGPRSRVFLGSSAAKIIRHAPVPVVVVP